MGAKPKNVLILAPYTNGYLDYIVEWMCYQGHSCDVVYLDDKRFSVTKLGEKLSSPLRKLLTGSSLRKYKRRKYIKALIPKGKYDCILSIRPEFMDVRTHIYLKSATEDYVAYLYDSLLRAPGQNKIFPFANRVLTYDPVDAKEQQIELRTNYIPILNNRAAKEKPTEGKDFYFISSFDKRINRLRKLAEYLEFENMSFNFTVVCKRKQKPLKHIKLLTQHISNQEVYKAYKEARYLVDLQRSDNAGLTFRVFEAMGLEKKLITDNPDVANYDFYNPNNILILDFSKEIHIPESFLQTSFQKIPLDILKKYTVKGWAAQVFNLSHEE